MPDASRKPSACGCARHHAHRRIVLTGGPGAGKTAVLEMLRHTLCSHIVLVPEAAGILYTGGFPRDGLVPVHRASQRAIFHVQWELEAIADVGESALIVCDRGVVDGSAYWAGDGSLWDDVGITRESALARYDAVIHLRTPDTPNGYGHQNPLRTETAGDAAIIDRKIYDAWEGHPRRFFVDASADFLTKARRAIALVQNEIPVCCRQRSSVDIARVAGRDAAVAASAT